MAKIVQTGFRSDYKTWGDGQTQPGHLAKVAPLAAQQVNHRSIALVEPVD